MDLRCPLETQLKWFCIVFRKTSGARFRNAGLGDSGGDEAEPLEEANDCCEECMESEHEEEDPVVEPANLIEVKQD